MKVKCIWCGSKLEPNAGFCGECDTGPEKNELACNGCRIKLSSNEKIYHLSESSGCLVYSSEYCKECYEAALIERAKREQIYKEEEKAARAQCKECRKPFPGIFRKKRYQANSLWDLTRDYYCEDCFLALPKNEKLDEPGDVSDPWA
jgi:hypothetical protein